MFDPLVRGWRFSVFCVLSVSTLFVETIEEKQKSDAVFAGDRLLEISIQLDPQDWRALRTQYNDDSIKPDHNGFKPSPYTYFKGDVTIDGVKIDSVGVRKKGWMGSVISTRPSLKFKFHEYVKDQRYSGLRRMTLNNNNQDPSRIHQYLVYKVFADAESPAPRCNLARVTVNGEYLGIYSNVESIKSEFLERHFSDASGNLYEGQLVDFRPGWDHFERKNNTSNPNRRDLDIMIEALETTDAELMSKLEPVIDVDAFMRFWALEVLTGHWDGYASGLNNFYLYHSPKSDKFHFIPWGADSAFGDRNPFITDELPASVLAEGILCHRLYRHPEGRKRYRAMMGEILESAWNEEELLRDVGRLENLIADHVISTSAIFKTGLEKVRNHIRTKGVAVRGELNRDAPEWERPLQQGGGGPAAEKGNLAGAFKTTWSDAALPNPFAGETTFTLKIGEEEVSFVRKGATAGPTVDPVRSKYPSVALFGLTGDGKMMVANFAVDPFKWGADVSIPVDQFRVFGALVELQLGAGFGEFKLIGMLEGTLELDQASRVAGEAVSGSVEAHWF